MNHNTSITNNSDWNRLTLGDLIDVLTDYTANGSFEALKLNVTYYTEQNYSALVRTTDLEKKNFKPERFTDKRGHDFQKKTALYGGEIVLANVGSVGKVYRVPTYDAPMTLAPNTYLVKFSKKHCNEYIFQFLKSEYYLSALYRNISSTTLAAINKDNFRSIPIDIPKSLSEQEKIANILNTVDNLIDQTENLINKYTAVKQGMMADLFSRGIDLSGTQETNNNYGQLRPSFEYAPELYQETKLGWIPKDWEIASLGEVADVIDPQPDHRTPPESENGIPYVGVGDFYWDQRIDRERCRKVIEAAYDKQRGRFQVELGDSIFGKIGTIGQPKQLRETEGFALSANILLIKAKEKNDYVFSFFDSVFFNKQLSNIINTTSQPALGIQTMRDILVVYPKCEKELHGITEKLKAINDSIVAYRKELHKYELIKKGLMQDLLTGKVKV